MFGLNYLILYEIERAKIAEEQRQKRRENMTPEQFTAFEKLELEQKEKAGIERRHKELCAAIRSTNRYNF